MGTVRLMKTDGSVEEVEVSRIEVDLGDGATLWVSPAVSVWYLEGHLGAELFIMGPHRLRPVLTPTSSNGWIASALPVVAKVDNTPSKA